MISVTPFEAEDCLSTEVEPDREDFSEVEYLLRRADEESIAAIRASDPRVEESHAGLAQGYSLASHALMARLDDAGQD